jgi:hypothetical protein
MILGNFPFCTPHGVSNGLSDDKTLIFSIFIASSAWCQNSLHIPACESGDRDERNLLFMTHPTLERPCLSIPQSSNVALIFSRIGCVIVMFFQRTFFSGFHFKCFLSCVHPRLLNLAFKCSWPFHRSQIEFFTVITISGRPENPQVPNRERSPFESTADIELIREWLFLNVSQVKPKLLKIRPKLLKTSQLEILLSDFFNGDYTRRSSLCRSVIKRDHCCW